MENEMAITRSSTIEVDTRMEVITNRHTAVKSDGTEEHSYTVTTRPMNGWGLTITQHFSQEGLDKFIASLKEVAQ
jgi:hypothetical protein